MEVIIFIFIIFVIIGVIAKSKEKAPRITKGRSSGQSSSEGEADRYQNIGYLLTPTELHFYKSLNHAINDDYLIAPKVRVADIVEPKNKTDRSAYMKAFNQINRKHIDFTLLDKTNLTVMMVIELDDNSHSRNDAKKRDEIKNQAFKDANINLKRFKVKKNYSIEEIREHLIS